MPEHDRRKGLLPRLGRSVRRMFAGTRPTHPPKTRVDVSIGVAEGASPFELDSQAPWNPVLTAASVTDVDAQIVADPFMIRVNGRWHMFFEVFNRSTMKGDIGHATSADGRTWKYDRIVLTEPFHLSYPHVFEWQGAYYMVPESRAAGSVHLYKATNFPAGWARVGTLLRDGQFADASVFRSRDVWWMFVETSGGRHDTLDLYVADDVTGPWRRHPRSRVVQNNPTIARPAGRVLSLDNRLFRFAQDCGKTYGSSVSAFEITTLTEDEYKESPYPGNPILAGSGAGWNSRGMHHMDAHPFDNGRWLACVDGFDEVQLADGDTR